jgi:hypothetical protein
MFNGADILLNHKNIIIYEKCRIKSEVLRSSELTSLCYYWEGGGQSDPTSGTVWKADELLPLKIIPNE